MRHLDYSSYNVTDDLIADGIRDFAGKKLSTVIEHLKTQQDVGAVRIRGTLTNDSLDRIAAAKVGLQDGVAPELTILDFNGRMTTDAFQNNIGYLKMLLDQRTFQFLDITKPSSNLKCLTNLNKIVEPIEETSY